MIRKLLAAVGVAGVLGGLVAASSAQAGPYRTFEPTGTYQFASNTKDGGLWRVANQPFTDPEASQGTTDTKDGPGVGLAINPPNGQYADSGVIIDAGTVADVERDGEFQAPAFSGHGELHMNLYVDTNGDGAYLSFGADGRYLGTAGDQVLFDVADNPPALDSLKLGPSGRRTHVWAWLGIAGHEASTADIEVFGSGQLVTTVEHPSKLTVANACRLNGSSVNLWTVSNVAGGRDRVFHLGVTYQGRTRWTGLHTVADGQSIVVATPNGGRATVLYYNGSGASGYVTPNPSAVSDHTRFCTSAK